MLVFNNSLIFFNEPIFIKCTYLLILIVIIKREMKSQRTTVRKTLPRMPKLNPLAVLNRQPANGGTSSAASAQSL